MVVCVPFVLKVCRSMLIEILYGSFNTKDTQYKQSYFAVNKTFVSVLISEQTDYGVPYYEIN